MFKLINTRILAGILAALLAIAALMVRQDRISERQAIAAEQAARLLKQQQDDLQAQKDHDAQFRKDIQAIKDRQNNNTAPKHDTWKTYIP